MVCVFLIYLVIGHGSSSRNQLLVLLSGFIGWFCSHSFFAFSSSKFLISTEVNMSFSNDMDDEYEKLVRRLNPPRYVLCKFIIFFF